MTLGQLVVLGSDGLIHVADVGEQGHDVSLLARPATGREVLSPVWAADGSWVAWSESDGVDGRIRVMQPDGELVIEQRGFPAFCLDPSPDGARLAFLSTGPLGLELAVMDIATGATMLVARGAPLFWAWAPSGNRLVVHVEDRVFIAELAALEGAVVETEVRDRVARFLAPWWSPGGGEIVFVDELSRLVAQSLDGDAQAVLVEGQMGYRYAVDPTGQRVATVVQRADTAVVEVLDRLTGDRVVAVEEAVAGLWWSPDGGRLLTMVRAADDEQPFVRWCVWNSADSESPPRSSPFQPSRVMAETVLPFFEQFAFAHRLWSPLSDAVVSAGILRTGRPEVFVQPSQPRKRRASHHL